MCWNCESVLLQCYCCKFFSPWKTPILFRLPYETMERVYNLNRLKAIPFYIHTPLPPPPHCVWTTCQHDAPLWNNPIFPFPLRMHTEQPPKRWFLKPLQKISVMGGQGGGVDMGWPVLPPLQPPLPFSFSSTLLPYMPPSQFALGT